MMRFVLVGMALALGCGDDAMVPVDAGGADGGGEDAGTVPRLDAGPTEEDAGPPPCVDDAEGSLPEDVEWVVLDGTSTELFSLMDGVLNAAAEGDFGTYDLNALEAWGGNGFEFDGPVEVLGASARWGNLGASGEATLQVFPDFGDNGFDFDFGAPLGSHTRCLSESDEGEWVTYVFDEAYAMSQPGRIWVGFHRPEATMRREGYASPVAELLFENFANDEEPFYSGIKWPDYDEEFLYRGASSTWFTWQVRLAVRRMDPTPPSERRFAGEDLPASPRRVAFGDYDGDGDEDLMMNGPRLMQNEGGVFTDVTTATLPEVSGTNGGLFGDYDDDGCLDYVGTGRREILLRSRCDGTFEDVTEAAGIDDSTTVIDCDGDGMPDRRPTEGAGWADIDADGRLDLYLAHYECSELGTYYPDQLFFAQPDGSYLDVSDDWVVGRDGRAGRGVTIGDHDRDGDVDVFVSNYRLRPNYFFENVNGVRFREVAERNGTIGELVRDAYGHTIGTAVGDIDGDGDFDLVLANLAHPRFYEFSDRTMVLINEDGAYTDEAELRGIVYRETNSNPTLFDADNDGDLDLFVTNVYPGRLADYYENDGTGRFTLRTYESGIRVENGWGAAAADVDDDGDVDLVAQRLWRNRGNDNHWLQVRAVGVAGNASAFGAVVEVEAGGATQLRMVSGGSGTTVQDAMTQHFGLGVETEVARVTVHFPYGESVTMEDVASDQRVWIFEDGFTATGQAPPTRD